MEKNMVFAIRPLILIMLAALFTIPQAFGKEEFSGFGFMDDESVMS